MLRLVQHFTDVSQLAFAYSVQKSSCSRVLEQPDAHNTTTLETANTSLFIVLSWGRRTAGATPLILAGSAPVCIRTSAAPAKHRYSAGTPAARSATA
ncbi:hypothetical protein DAT35_56275 [Vitiosangium sp. GDMCC 1.1324]|nr:hypothetical protein DAT35_56275 [Vitiosangium sp. GDMCC 1.1324]